MEQEDGYGCDPERRHPDPERRGPENVAVTRAIGDTPTPRGEAAPGRATLPMAQEDSDASDEVRDDPSIAAPRAMGATRATRGDAAAAGATTPSAPVLKKKKRPTGRAQVGDVPDRIPSVSIGWFKFCHTLKIMSCCCASNSAIQEI